MERRGWTLKSWTRRTGVFRCGGRFAQNSLRRLLRNTLYAGWICHKGIRYAGEHKAILEPAVWERVQEVLESGPVAARGQTRNKHHALLNGLLYCEPCGARMVYAWAGKKDRRYPYYVCLNAQRKGRAACPGRSLPAHRIEQSVVGQLQDAQPAMAVASGGGEAFDRGRQVATIQAMVERIGYDGRTGKVSIRFRTVGTATMITTTGPAVAG